VAKTWVLVAAILGSAMTFIDGSAVNVVLPVIQRELEANAAQMQWVVEGYSLFLAALILLGGSLGDLYGRKRLFVLGIVSFALSSMAFALALGWRFYSRASQIDQPLSPLGSTPLGLHPRLR